jgi:outer membrane protein assembly factor BamB
VLHTDNTVEALDDTNAVVGSTSIPAMPDGTWGRGGLDVSQFGASPSLACGTQRSNTDTKVFCVDALAHLVWSKVSAVAGGLARQVDGVIVIASDTWSHAISSEVLRTSDGATLLAIPSVRLGAALVAANGTLEGALASEPNVTLYDATGAVKWTWKQQYPSEAIHAKRSGGNIVVALHSPIATGTQLLALDAATGTLAWRGNVDSLPIAHSKYSNRVDLDVRGSTVLLVGRESSQEYAQSFDASSGHRTASVLRGR